MSGKMTMSKTDENISSETYLRMAAANVIAGFFENSATPVYIEQLLQQLRKSPKEVERELSAVNDKQLQLLIESVGQARTQQLSQKGTLLHTRRALESIAPLPKPADDGMDHGDTVLRVQKALGITDTGWVSPDVVLHYLGKAITPAPAAPTERDERMVAEIVQGMRDADRWRKVLARTGATGGSGRQYFTIEHVYAVNGANLLKGSAAEHFTDAIDALPPADLPPPVQWRQLSPADLEMKRIAAKDKAYPATETPHTSVKMALQESHKAFDRGWVSAISAISLDPVQKG